MGVHQDRNTYQAIKDLLDIPSDEPIFILRAQDRFSVPTLADYLNNVVNGTDNEHNITDDWFNNMRAIGQKFFAWQRDNLNKVKVPD